MGPFEVRRRVGAVDVAGLEVLDLTDGAVRSLLSVTMDDLTGDDYSRAQEVAEAAQAAGFGGILAPSAAMEGRKTLVVFATGFPSIVLNLSRVRRPPPRLADLIGVVRRRGDSRAHVHTILEKVAEGGSDQPGAGGSNHERNDKRAWFAQAR